MFLNLKGAVCRDVATGKQLWTIDEPLEYGSASSAVIASDILVGHVKAADRKQGGHFQGYRLSDSGAKKLWRDEFLPLDENLTVSMADSKTYLVGRDTIRCLDAATGKKLGERIFDPMAEKGALGIGSNQWLGIVGDRLFLSPEGQHGRQSLVMLDRGPGLKMLGQRWVPANNTTTAYGRMSIAFPVVDGRVFVRGADGLYCYDLRK